ncbi:hypothetical protein MASR1M36_08560 [Candidatus Cloacimonadaceae bacterium]
MKKTGLVMILISLLWGLLTAIPQPLHMIPSTKSKEAPFGTDLFHIQGKTVYCLDKKGGLIKAWDIEQKAFIPGFLAKLPLGTKAEDICGDENNLYILDSKASAIQVFSYEGKLNRSISGKGSKDIQFKKAIRLLVNFQGYLYVLDAGRNELLSFTNEGMFLGKVDVFSPISMCIGQDQVIRVLLDKKTHQEMQSFDIHLNPGKSYEILTPQNKPDYVADIAINQYGEVYTLYTESTKLGKVDSNGRLLGKTWGSKEKSDNMVSFLEPTRIKSIADQNNAILAILDSKSKVVKLYLDSDPINLEKLEVPPLTMRPNLEKIADPFCYDNVFTDSTAYYLYDTQVQIGTEKKITRAVACKKDGKTLWTIFTAGEAKRGVKGFDALAVHNGKLFVVDTKGSKIFVYNSQTGEYLESFASKGSKDGRLNSPRSIVIAPDGMIYVADWGNSRIAVFSENTMFIENIEFTAEKLKPQLLRLSGSYLFFLANEGKIFELPLSNTKKLTPLANMKKISTFDIIYDDRLGFIDGVSQQLYILHNNKAEHKYFSFNPKAVFPGFAKILHIRYNPRDKSLFICDRLADSARKLSFYYSPKKPKTIHLGLNANRKAELQWDVAEGINRWRITEDSERGTFVYIVTEPKYVVNKAQASINKYSVCAISADGKTGPSSEEIEDAWSYANYLTVNGNYGQAVLALQRATKTISDPRLNEEIVNNYMLEAHNLQRLQEYEKAIKTIEAAIAVGGNRKELIMAKVEVYKQMKSYQLGIDMLEKFRGEDRDLQRQLISLYYLNRNYPKVQSLASVYLARFDRDAEVLSHLAMAYENQNDFNSALISQRELVAIQDNLDNNLRIGELLIKTQQYDAASSHLQRMLTRFGDQGGDSINKLLGDVSYAKGDYGNATDYYESAIRINPGNAEYYYRNGLAFTEGRKALEAKINLAKAWELNPENVDYAFAFARALERESRFTEALAVLDDIYRYVRSDASSTSYKDFYADLLIRERRLDDAVNVLQTAVQYAPQDQALLNKLQSALLAREEENKTKSAITVKAFQFDLVFPALIESYKTNPIGLIKLINNRSVPIRDVKITITIPQVADNSFMHVIPSLLAGQDHVVDIVMPLNRRLFELCKDGPVQFPTSLAIDYYENDQPLRIVSTNITMNAMGITAMNWKDRKQYASFVNPQDENLRVFVNTQITQLFSGISTSQLNKNIQRAIQIWSYYSANGLRYVSDNTASNVVSAEVDYVQFPFQTLVRKGGDCDDLLALLAGSLSVIGVPCGFLDVPNHVMLIFDTGMKPEEVMSSGIEVDQFLFRNDKYWVPLETTLLGKENFTTSWREAIKRYKDYWEKGISPVAIEFTDAHKLYPPAPYTEAIPVRQFDGASQAQSLFRSDSESIMLMSQISKEEEFRNTLAKYPSNLNVKNQYALWCVQNDRSATAQDLWNQILRQDPANFAALTNLGSLLLSNGLYQEARIKLLEALKQNREKDNVIRNLCILEYRSGNLSKAREYFYQLSDRNVLKNLDPKTYADLMGGGE